MASPWFFALMQFYLETRKIKALVIIFSALKQRTTGNKVGMLSMFQRPRETWHCGRLIFPLQFDIDKIAMGNKIKVVTWNCAMALRRKLSEVSGFAAHVMVLQECSRADAYLLETIGLKLACWTGNNQHKGLALAARPELKLTARPIRGVQWGIRGTTAQGLGIIAMWACATKNSSERYIRQVHKVLDRGILDTMPPRSMFLGDFNSNTIWDGMHRQLNHSRVVEKFAKSGYRSAYHDLRGEIQGRESTPTLFLQRNRRKAYHIDYAFLSPKMLIELRTLTIGAPAAWLRLSDHMPLEIEFGP